MCTQCVMPSKLFLCFVELISFCAAVRPIQGPAHVKSHACASADHVGIFALNLDRRPDRLSSLSAVLRDQWSWACERTCRVSAPDGARLDYVDYAHRSVISPHVWSQVLHPRPDSHERTGERSLSRGAVGCLVGHALIWEQIVQRKLPYAIVMEDDITAVHQYMQHFICSLSATPNWELLSFSSPDDGHFDPTRNFTVEEGHAYTTAMYAITQEGARKALKAMFPLQVARQLDDPHSAFRGLRGFKAVPRAVTQRGSKADTDVQTSLLEMHRTNASQYCSITNCEALHVDTMLVPGLASLATATRN